MIRRVITDQDILAGRVTAPIVLDGDTLLTPAARDRAVARGIEIREAGTEPSPAGSAGRAAHGAARLDELSDGLYLVRVEGGRPVSVLPATGPGLMTSADGAGGS